MSLLTLTSAYKRTSTDALQIIAGTLPLDVEIQKAAIIRNGITKEAATNIAENEGQSRWDDSSKGRWTHSFLSCVKIRLILPLKIDHYVSQMVGGHGDFNAKLSECKLTEDPTCSCGMEEETAEHGLYNCKLYYKLREDLKNELSMVSINWKPKNEEYATTRRSWNALATFARRALVQKEELRQNENEEGLEDDHD